MRKLFAIILMVVVLGVLIGCESKPTAMEAKQLLPKDVQERYEKFETESFGHRAEAYSNCLSRASNDISAKYCEESENNAIKFDLSAQHVDFFLRYFYLPDDNHRSKTKQATERAEKMKVLAVYDLGRCDMNNKLSASSKNYATFTVATCDNLKK